MDAHIFYFNKVFKSYLLNYVKDIDNIYLLKNGKIDTRIYASAILDGTIGFEGLHFYLIRIHKAFILIDILWKLLLNHDKEYNLFKYIFEVVISQLFEEYAFVKTVLKELEASWTTQASEPWIIDFLYFYEHFMWKNKKFVEMYDNYSWFFKKNQMRFPSPYYLGEKLHQGIMEKLMALRDPVEKRKHVLNNKMTYKELSEISNRYFRELSLNCNAEDHEWLLFSRRSILNKLENDKIQKRVNRDETRYLTQNKGSDASIRIDLDYLKTY